MQTIHLILEDHEVAELARLCRDVLRANVRPDFVAAEHVLYRLVQLAMKDPEIAPRLLDPASLREDDR